MFSENFKTINIHDGKIYYGSPSEKRNPHICFNKKLEKEYKGQLKCFYCDMEFLSRNRLFRHLGYNNVDIRMQPNKEYEKFKRKRNKNLHKTKNKIGRIKKKIEKNKKKKF